MILYDNKNNLIGASKDTLNFLGYEDMEEFKNYSSDIADLFIAKSGYVHKFNNFSWIDYVLHSGAANKSAIIKLKNGKEAEVEISIKEMQLINPTKDDSIYYNVDLKNPLYRSGTTVEDAKELEKEPPSAFVVTEEKEESVSFENSSLSLTEDEQTSPDEQILINKEEDTKEDIAKEPVSLKLPADENLEPIIKLKEPDLPAQEEKEDKEVTLSLKEDNFEPQSSFADNNEVGFKADISVQESDTNQDGFVAQNTDEFVIFGGDDKKDENIENNEEDDFLKIHALPKNEPEIKTEEVQKSIFDIQKSVDFLGISQEEINGFINEYIDYTDEVDSKFLDAIENKDIKNIQQIGFQLKSLAEILCIDDLGKSLGSLCKDGDKKFYDEYKKDLENLKRTQV